MAKESKLDLFCDDICLSIIHLSENVKDQESTSNLLTDDNSISKLINETENDHVFPISDAKYAEELQLQEAIMASLDTAAMASLDTAAASSDAAQKSLVSREEERGKGKEIGESSHTHSFCNICAEKKGSYEMFTVESCNHLFCNDCINKHIEIKIQTSYEMVKCPGLGCKVSLELDDCKSIVESNVLDKWNKMLCESLIPLSQRFYCPYKDCSALLVKDSDEEVTASECPICHRLFCAVCSVPWHGDVECDEFQRLGDDERGREDLMVRMLAKEKEWNRCPSCKFFVEKTEGCIHMTCRCGFQFCYACGVTWTSDHGGCRP